jgi:hypothetical protein
MTNKAGVRVWQPGYDDIWKQNGVWDMDSQGRPQLLRPAHFTRVRGQEVGFRREYYPRFAVRFAESIRAVDPRALIFIQGEPGERAPAVTDTELPNMVYAPHWYDGITLMVRRYLNHFGVDSLKRRLVIGSHAIQQSFSAQLGVFKYEAAQELGGVPVLLGEFGIPFDLHNQPFLRAADELLTTRALDRSFRALEANMLSGTIWNYTADNIHGRGDAFNGEDLSIFCRSEQEHLEDIHSGGRALRAVVRPYPRATAGEPLRLSYDWQSRTFDFAFRHNPNATAPTEIFVPFLHYPHGLSVQVSDGTYTYDAAANLLIYNHDPAHEVHEIIIKPVQV